MSTIKLEKCEPCFGTGRPGGVMGGPGRGLCGYCCGAGHVPMLVPMLAASPSPASPAVAGLVDDCESIGAEYGAVDQTYPTAATALRGAAAALSRLQARLAEVTAEREAEITEINRWQDEATRFAKVAEKAEASAAAMREALTDLNQHVHVLSIGQIRKRIRGAISRGDNGQG
jgi:hypothetical protein